MMKTGPNSDLIGTPALKADSNYSLCSSNWCKLSAFARTRCKRCGFPGIFSFLESNQPPAVKPNIFINKFLCLSSIRPFTLISHFSKLQILKCDQNHLKISSVKMRNENITIEKELQIRNCVHHKEVNNRLICWNPSKFLPLLILLSN